VPLSDIGSALFDCLYGEGIPEFNDSTAPNLFRPELWPGAITSGALAIFDMMPLPKVE